MGIPNLKARKKARLLLMQAIYQWEMTGMDIYPIQQQFHAMNDMTKCDTEYFDTILLSISKIISTIDAAFEKHLDRKFNELNPIELAVIRLGTYELLHQLEIPYRIILDEAIGLTKTYGSTDGYKYVNGILNKVARDVRVIEFSDSI